MKIYRDILEHLLLLMPQNPPEIGGILGTSNNIIDKFQLDKGLSTTCGCYYTPNTKFLNTIIHSWEKERVKFSGIFHTHFFNVNTLSSGDKKYITEIMQAMPDEIYALYFPIITIPEMSITPYIATRYENCINIEQDKFVIIEKQCESEVKVEINNSTI